MWKYVERRDCLFLFCAVQTTHETAINSHPLEGLHGTSICVVIA